MTALAAAAPAALSPLDKRLVRLLKPRVAGLACCCCCWSISACFAADAAAAKGEYRLSAESLALLRPPAWGLPGRPDLHHSRPGAALLGAVLLLFMPLHPLLALLLLLPLGP